MRINKMQQDLTRYNKIQFPTEHIHIKFLQKFSPGIFHRRFDKIYSYRTFSQNFQKEYCHRNFLNDIPMEHSQRTFLCKTLTEHSRRTFLNNIPIGPFHILSEIYNNTW